ncbi:MAG: hypothetical protein R3B72_47450 [Polyangiaceae bacterium]
MNPHIPQNRSASPRFKPHLLWLAPMLLALGVACGGEGEEGEGALTDVSTDVCGSGLQWTGGDEESPLMHPGLDCIGCHADRGEGPSYEAAGTVYGAFGEADDCAGLEGVLVEITDANGTLHSATTNRAGNFFIEDASIATPITAKVTRAGNSLEMVDPVPSANCPTCHTSSGANGASGRIVAP